MLLEQDQKLGAWAALTILQVFRELQVPLGPHGKPKKSCYCPRFTDVETEAAATQSGSGAGPVSVSRAQYPAAGLLSPVQISCDVTVTVSRVQPFCDAYIFFQSLHKFTRESCDLKDYYLLTVFFVCLFCLFRNLTWQGVLC